MSRVAVILQARMGSTRLPGKVLAPLCGRPMLGVAVGRLLCAQAVDEVVVATTDLPEDDPVNDYCAASLGCGVFRGSAEDVLSRYRECARRMGADVVVRVTGDNPAVDPEVVDSAVRAFAADGGLDYLHYREGLPLGLGVEVFSAGALERAHSEADDPECREHVTPYLYRNPSLFNIAHAPCEGEDCSQARLTVDTFEDLETMRNVFAALGGAGSFGWADAVSLLRRRPEIALNGDVAQRQVAYRGAEP